MEWSTETARQFATQGNLEAWIHAYLGAGNWANARLSDGLKKAPRWWLGPLSIPIAAMIRTCGPEAEMPYKVTMEQWERKTQNMALELADPIMLPPVILQSVKGKLYVCDGNHRTEAARKKGWQALWAIIWFDSEAEWNATPLRHESR